MPARLASDFWVSAYLRRCNGENRPATLRRRGAAAAGAVFIVLDHLDGRQTLYGPAPQAVADADGERLFEVLVTGDALAITDRLAREAQFDADLWVIDVEARDGDARLPLAPGAP